MTKRAEEAKPDPRLQEVQGITAKQSEETERQARKVKFELTSSGWGEECKQLSGSNWHHEKTPKWIHGPNFSILFANLTIVRRRVTHLRDMGTRPFFLSFFLSD